MIQSAYRFLLADLMPFGNRTVIRLEYGGQNLSREHYEACGLVGCAGHAQQQDAGITFKKTSCARDLFLKE